MQRSFWARTRSPGAEPSPASKAPSASSNATPSPDRGSSSQQLNARYAAHVARKQRNSSLADLGPTACCCPASISGHTASLRFRRRPCPGAPQGPCSRNGAPCLPADDARRLCLRFKGAAADGAAHQPIADTNMSVPALRGVESLLSATATSTNGSPARQAPAICSAILRIFPPHAPIGPKTFHLHEG